MALTTLLVVVSACAAPWSTQSTSSRSPGATLSPIKCRPALTLSPAANRTHHLAGRIAFADGDPFQIWVMHADGSARTQLTDGPGPRFSPAWSPDGRRIAFRDSRFGINNNDEIYVMNADGSGQINLTHNPANDWSPAWAPDGAQIAFASTRESGSPNVFVMRADGSQVRQLTHSEGEYPTWSPDGTQIAYASSETGTYQIKVLNADGSRQRSLTHAAHYNMYPAWSPDGTAIAYDTQQDFATLTDVGAGPEFEIHVMQTDGTCDLRLTSNTLEDRFPTWSPDGSSLAWIQQGQIAMMNADGSGQRLLGSGHFPAWHS